MPTNQKNPVKQQVVTKTEASHNKLFQDVLQMKQLVLWSQHGGDDFPNITTGRNAHR